MYIHIFSSCYVLSVKRFVCSWWQVRAKRISFYSYGFFTLFVNVILNFMWIIPYWNYTTYIKIKTCPNMLIEIINLYPYFCWNDHWICGKFMKTTGWNNHNHKKKIKLNKLTNEYVQRKGHFSLLIFINQSHTLVIDLWTSVLVLSTTKWTGHSSPVVFLCFEAFFMINMIHYNL